MLVFLLRHETIVLGYFCWGAFSAIDHVGYIKILTWLNKMQQNTTKCNKIKKNVNFIKVGNIGWAIVLVRSGHVHGVFWNNHCPYNAF